MAPPRIIKKYPNRRLYDTETSTYITLAEVKDLVLGYKIFMVQDAKTGDDLTRAILLQIILEEESGGVPMFSTDMLANIIRYYGHAMQGLMGSYLERSIFAFHEAQKRFQAQATTLYGELPKMPFVPGTLFRKFSARRWPAPRQVPRKLTRRTSSRPSSVTPALERAEFGGVASTPSRRRIPLGRPSATAK